MSTDINPIETARELATHANDIEHLQADMDKLVKDMEEVKKSLADIHRMLSESAASKKVWHTIFTVGAGLVGGVIVWALDRVWK